MIWHLSRLLPLYLFLLLSFLLLQCSDKSVVISGPMVGAVGMRSALVWLQLDPKKIHTSRISELQIFSSQQKSYFSTSVDPKTGILLWEIPDLEPGTHYKYKVTEYLEARGEFSTKPLWKYRISDPPDFSFVIASCNYVNEEPYDRKGKPWGGGYEIFQAIEKETASFFLWMGDNVYLREADWDSPSGILHRYSHTRALPESKKVFASMPHFAIWDDHDYGPNDSSLSYSLADTTEKVFKDFWPDFNYPGKGIYRSFTWGDAEFFLLDNRRFRSANKNFVSGKRTILGERQLQWFFNALADSTSRFKFIVMGGQFLNSAPVYENYVNYAEERMLILDSIRKMKIENVFFLTGDRHHSEVSAYSENKNFTIYEFTVSPLTAGIPSGPILEKNQYRIPGSLLQERLYGVVTIWTSDGIRKVRIDFKNLRGEVLYSYEVN